MKLMIASDIHGSAFYCEQMIEAYKREGADKLLLLGDILYHGPRNDLPEGYAPKAVIAMLNPMKKELLCVRGNCDTEVDQMVLEFPILADYCMLDLGTKLVYATHGHLTSAEQLPPLREGDLFLQGHTHVPMNEVKNGIRCMNPGSVSLPKQDSWRGYMILETNQKWLKFSFFATLRISSSGFYFSFINFRTFLGTGHNEDTFIRYSILRIDE